MSNFVYNIRFTILLLSLCAPLSTHACISHYFNCKVRPAMQMPVTVPVQLPTAEPKGIKAGLKYINTLTQRAKKFDYATAKQSTVQALKSAGSFMKATAQAHPYKTVALCTGLAASGYLWYQYNKHAWRVKDLEAQIAHLEKNGIDVPKELTDKLIRARQNRDFVEAETLSKHFKRLPRPAILVPAIIGGACVAAVGLDIAKTFKLAEGLSYTRFLLPNHTINLLPKQSGAPVSFTGYKAIFKFAAQQHFKPYDILAKTCFGAGALSLGLTSGWIKLRNKAARK